MASTSTSTDLAALPTPRSITLLLKSRRSTTLLSVQPTSAFEDIKISSSLLFDLAMFPDVPESPTSIEFGVLADRRDPSKGWVSLALRAKEIAAGKGAKKATGDKKNGIHTVEGAGLGDGTWLAWRVRNSKKAQVEVDEDGDAVVADSDEEDDPGWDVEIPVYDDEEEEVEAEED